MVPKYEYLSHNEFTVALEMLVDHVKDLPEQPKRILAFKRGGLVLGVYLSHALNLPMEVVESSKYDFLEDLSIPECVRNCPDQEYLIVDDIIDTGETLEEFVKKSKVRNYQIVTLVGTKKFEDQDRITFVYTKDDNSFTVFPWETVDSNDN